MNTDEAKALLDRKVLELKTLSYAAFKKWQIDRHTEIAEIQGDTGKSYQIEVQAILENIKNPNETIRVIASIDDGHLLSITTYFPITRDFIIAPDNSIVAE